MASEWHCPEMDIGVVIKGVREERLGHLSKSARWTSSRMYIADAVGIIVGTDGSDGRPRLTKRRTYYKFLFSSVSLEKRRIEEWAKLRQL